VCVNVREFVGFACGSVLESESVFGEHVIWESVFECACKGVKKRVEAFERV
jgi:hypothetical protein